MNEELDSNDLYFEVLEQKESTDEEKMSELVQKVNRKLLNLQNSLEKARAKKMGYGQRRSDSFNQILNEGLKRIEEDDDGSDLDDD